MSSWVVYLGLDLGVYFGLHHVSQFQLKLCLKLGSGDPLLFYDHWCHGVIPSAHSRALRGRLILSAVHKPVTEEPLPCGMLKIMFPKQMAH